MGSQETIKEFERLVSALADFDLDSLRGAIREELMAEVRDEIRQELIDEIHSELESAANDAARDDAPEIGTDGDWGKDEAVGLARWLEFFDGNW